MNAALVGLSAAVGYLIGSISFSRVVARVLSPRTDLKQIGFRDEQDKVFVERLPSATTVSMALGWKPGCVISVLDMLKVFLPVMALRLAFPGEPYFLVAAVFGLIGNNWPVYYRFKGGFGISAIYGGLLAVDPLGISVCVAAGFVLGMLLLRSMILTFVSPLLLLLPWFWLRTYDPTYLYYVLAILLIYLVTLVPDILRYWKARKTTHFSERDVMESMPMGRGMLKMLDRLKLEKK